VRLPKDWIGDAQEVELTREGDRIIIQPSRATLGQFHRKFSKNPIQIERVPQGRTKPRSLNP